jgi:Cell division protein FtsQ
VLGPALLSSSLPTLAGFSLPQPGAHLHARMLLEAVTVLGAAPAPLARYASKVYLAGQRGLAVAMRNGLIVYFGDAWRPHAKWDSLARVLADPSSAGASYVDVRVPERPAAGFPDGVAPDAPAASASSSEEAGSTTPRSAVSTLAEGLAAEVPSAPSPSTPTSEESKSEADTEQSSSASGEAVPSSGEASQPGPTEGG